MSKLVSVAEMRAIEQAADELGLSYAQMLENAGRGLAEAVFAHSHRGEKSVVALVGAGNNGSDALVALAALGVAGWKTGALLLGKRFSHDEYVKRARKAGATIRSLDFDNHQTLDEHAEWLRGFGCVLDGILGTGVRTPVREPLARVMAAIKANVEITQPKPFIVAVDCPSGMDCDTGEVAPQALSADLTVCMGAVKYGMLTLPAFGYLGELVIADIGVTNRVRQWAEVKRHTLDEASVRAMLPPRPLGAHKGTFGRLLVVAGSLQYPGAALLAGRAGYRAGAGLVQMAVPKTVQPLLAGHLPEATWLPLAAQEGWIAENALKPIKELLPQLSAVLLGPGLGLSPATGEFVGKLLKEKLPPVVVDADGLNLMAAYEDWFRRFTLDAVLTPHPGEMAVLTGLSTEEIQRARIEIAEEYARTWHQVVVLKGAFTVVAAPDGRTALLPLASPALARAGSGDVLAGLIAGLRAQGTPAFEAACCGVWLHGQAGLRAAAAHGRAAVLAGDLLDSLPNMDV
ncbi:MAG TPA: NAD(P)H-hydrate dehydratase [Anaerolineales bacterium]|nr:NAD(P)H-hydrate dehydratase [Anaerolineales bacterium]